MHESLSKSMDLELAAKYPIEKTKERRFCHDDLIVQRGPLNGRRLQISKFPMTIGRDDSNDLAINDTEISRFHLRIKQRGRLVIVEDLESRNGTYLNGDRVLNAIVRTGDKLILGGTELIVALMAPEVQFASEIMDFDMLVDEGLGLKGPISFSEDVPPPQMDQIQLTLA